ncbi:MAG TPA: hypothetical protein ACFYD4_08385 [Candidatus Wunengus sp. YC61]|uniref:hypothetical protein n=1 Tax=Candidatus Wunengus sp. YC61 TaxID=3367698 RepID=UPI004024DF46
MKKIMDNNETRHTHDEWLKIYCGSDGAELVEIMKKNIKAKQELIDRLIAENVGLKKGRRKMKYKLHWNWFKIFRKNWYTGNRLEYQPELAETYTYLYDLGTLTIIKYK